MKIILRALRNEDNPILYGWVNDRELIQYTNYFHPVSETEHDEWFKSVSINKGQVFFGIEDEDEKKLIGTCGLFEIDEISRKAELRIKIGDKEYWGHGAGTNAVKLLVEFGFSSMNLNKIWLKVMKDNVRAVKSYEKVGFIIEGELKQDMFINGEYKDILLMALFKINKQF
jgi:RimJ/RimL family protein N-acetyltransferase